MNMSKIKWVGALTALVFSLAGSQALAQSSKAKPDKRAEAAVSQDDTATNRGSAQKAQAKRGDRTDPPRNPRAEDRPVNTPPPHSRAGGRSDY